MGFFSDIIRMSQRPLGHATSEGAPRIAVAPAGVPVAAGESSGPMDPGDGLSHSHTPPQPFWEEGVGQRGTARSVAQQPLGSEVRQVVGPSPSEHTEASELAKAPGSQCSSPVIGKPKQTGLNNRRDAAVRPWMNRDPNLHGLVSTGGVVSRSEDAFGVESVTKRSERHERGKSVDATHRSRQAGLSTRAGATTPPDPMFTDGPAVTPVRSARPMAVPTLSGATDRPSSTAPQPGVEPMVPDNPQPMPDMASEAAGITDIAHGNLPGAPEADASPARATSVAAMAREVFAAPLSPSADRPRPQVQAAETPPPRDEPAVTAAAPGPRHEAAEPAVHIGLVEVVVLAPQSSGTARRATFRQGNDFASRHYLRNL